MVKGARVAFSANRMADFKEKARRYAEALQEEEERGQVREGAPAPPERATRAARQQVEEAEGTSSEDEEELSSSEDEQTPAKLQSTPAPGLAAATPASADEPVEASLLANPSVAMLFLKADKTRDDASWGEAIVDRTVQFGQPYPAVTHCEMWVGERANKPSDDNHFSTYLGATTADGKVLGATWTSGLANSCGFYACGDSVTEEITRRMARSSWSAVPIFAPNAAEKLRRECNLHQGTPYPPGFLLWQYPMSTWPLRAFAGLADDRVKAPAHCAALSARILRTALPQTVAFAHPSHWYGPSSLYLELTTPTRMEQTLAAVQPTVRAKVEEEALDRLADTLTQHSDDDVAAMRRKDAHKALEQLAIHVLRAGSRSDGAEVDQDDFRDAQERYAWGLCRYTWKHRMGAQL